MLGRNTPNSDSQVVGEEIRLSRDQCAQGSSAVKELHLMASGGTATSDRMD
jgi:hypothetical protein